MFVCEKVIIRSINFLEKEYKFFLDLKMVGEM